MMPLIVCGCMLTPPTNMRSMAYAKSDRIFLREFGLRVRKLRQAADWSQEEFAEHCNLWNSQTGKLNITAILQAASKEEETTSVGLSFEVF